MSPFLELSIILGITSFISILMYYLKQPLVIGYIISGILCGGYFLNIAHSIHTIELFPKLGIVILLFTIGLHLNPDTLKETGKSAVLAGLFQVLISGGIGFLLSLYVLHYNVLTSFLISLALSFSSTIIVLKILSDKKEIDKLHSKMSIGILLIQDIIAAIVLLVISIFNTNNNSLQTDNTSFLFLFILKAIFLILIYGVLKVYVFEKLAKVFASSQETLLIFSLGISFLMASLFYYFGFSLEIGALFAGIALSSTNFAKEMSSRLKSLQDFFIAIFFILLGVNLIVVNIKDILLPIFVFVLFVIIIKFLIVFLVMNILKHKSRTSFLTAISLTQVSEFSIIMIALVSEYGYLDKNITSLITIVAIISMAISAYLLGYADNIYNKIKHLLKYIEINKKNTNTTEHKIENFDVVIFGYDRVGHEFINVFNKIKYKYLLVDINPKYIENAIFEGIKAIYGDAEDVGFLEDNKILESQMLISTIPDFKTNLFLAEIYRKKNKDGIIILTCHDISHSKILYEKGANYVIMPYHLGAKHASQIILEYTKNKNAFVSERELTFK